jgi:hypothetical protein
MDHRVANHVLKTLESTATELEGLLEKRGNLSREAAAALSKAVNNIDAFSDKFEAWAYGEESFKKRQAKVLEQDSDEPYMKTFENPQKVIDGDPDESYMHETGASFQGDSIKTFDSDDTSQVTDRKEHQVRELSEWSDSTKTQPSWSGGSAGKSTAWG